MEKQQNHFAASLNPEEIMDSLKALREKFNQEVLKVANAAKTATFEKKRSQIRDFSRVLHEKNKEELQFLREERAAIREYDAGMSRNRAEYLSVLDVPCMPTNSNNQT